MNLPALNSRRLHWAALLAVLLAGAALRLPLLDRVPYGIFYDEAINGQDALDVWRPGGTGFRIYYADAEGFPREPFYQTILAFTVRAFGNSVVALRATSAIIGLLTILMVYFFTRRWVGEAEALAAAGVLATLRWHVIFSRLIFRTLVLGPYMLGVVWVALEYRRRPTLARAGLLGVLIGGGFYTYLAWWFMLPVVAGAVVWLFFRTRTHTDEHGRTRTGGGRRHLAVLALAAGLAYLPMGIYFLRHPDVVMKRPGAVSIFSGKPEIVVRAMLKNAGEAALMFHLWGDHVPIQNVPGPSSLASFIFQNHFPIDPQSGAPFIGRPALDTWQGIAFLIGLVLAFRLLRRRRSAGRSAGRGAGRGAGSSAGILPASPFLSPLSALLLSWLFFGWLTTVLTRTDSPNFLRTQCLTPVVAILTGLGLVRTGQAAARRWGARAGTALVAFLLLASAAQTAREVYFVWPGDPAVWQRFHGDLTDLARAAAAAPDDVAVMFPGERFVHPTVQFLTFGRKNIFPYQDPATALGPWPPGEAAKNHPKPRRRWIILTLDDKARADAISAQLPQEAGMIKKFFSPRYNATWAIMVNVPEASLPPQAAMKNK